LLKHTRVRLTRPSTPPPVSKTMASAAWRPASCLASGAHPATTFPNSHLLSPLALPSPSAGQAAVGAASWSSPRPGSPLEDLRQAVREEDWEHQFSEGHTAIHMRAEWSASIKRCSVLQWLAATNHARRALEIGSFCGAGALALAETLPADGEVVALELDPFVVDFGRRFQMRCLAGQKIHHNIGPAAESLRRLAGDASSGRLQRPFDMAVVDADKEGMREYFNLLWKSPNLLSEEAIVCVDMTPFKGQPPVRYVKYGFPHRWACSSGQEEIDALRSSVMASPDFLVHEFGGLLVVQRASAPQQ